MPGRPPSSGTVGAPCVWEPAPALRSPAPPASPLLFSLPLFLPLCFFPQSSADGVFTSWLLAMNESLLITIPLLN